VTKSGTTVPKVFCPLVWHKKFGKRIDANVAFPGCHSDQQTAEQFASHFKAVYHPSVDDSASVDEFLYKHENYVASNGKTADADKLCIEVSTELKMWDTF